MGSTTTRERDNSAEHGEQACIEIERGDVSAIFKDGQCNVKKRVGCLEIEQWRQIQIWISLRSLIQIQ